MHDKIALTADDVMPAVDDSAAARMSRLADRLTPEQRMFAEHYSDSFDVEEAYAIAFPGARNLTPEVVTRKGFVLVNRWYIREYIAARLETDQVDDVLCTRAEVLCHLRKVMLGSESERVQMEAAKMLLDQVAPANATPGIAVQVNVQSGLTEDKIDAIRNKVVGITGRPYSVGRKKDVR